MTPNIAVFGASGLIGTAVARQLMDDGFSVLPIARSFTRSQRAAFPNARVEVGIASYSADDIERLLAEAHIDIIVNCMGVLQDGPGGTSRQVHNEFVENLIGGIKARDNTPLLIQLSIPGAAAHDATVFSQTKRQAEQVIAAGGIEHVILRPGFVIARTAFGGSALVRGLATLPFDLPLREAQSPFAVTDVADIAQTIDVVARRWGAGERGWAVSWDVHAQQSLTVGAVVSGFRRHFGGPEAILRLPSWVMDLGAKAGDVAGVLGWRPPIRTTALAEMRRGVMGDPTAWMAATGVRPRTLDEILSQLPASIQENWFARLFLLKGLVLATLVVFWIASGMIALFGAFDAATAILTAHGVPLGFGRFVTVASSSMDIAVGLAIAFRRVCRAGLLAGIALSIFYMFGAAILTPELWIEPLGALVKTGPAIVLMILALAILGDR